MTWCCRSSRSSSDCSSHVSWKGIHWELECKNLPHRWAVDNLCFVSKHQRLPEEEVEPRTAGLVSMISSAVFKLVIHGTRRD